MDYENPARIPGEYLVDKKGISTGYPALLKGIKKSVDKRQFIHKFRISFDSNFNMRQVVSPHEKVIIHRFLRSYPQPGASLVALLPLLDGFVHTVDQVVDALDAIAEVLRVQFEIFTEALPGFERLLRSWKHLGCQGPGAQQDP